ncbi:hypothetical protein SAMN05421835_11368 [Amycolatopsis sacchari]|uniref:Uncharacterized protein n=1 Tax=Amycolatopsis sacchari TaxID=115433 RepID=A0A1I3WK83_9PSEU|nr:hypothetical protein SAMN05421835_11368 [Amycolatopsis sacchari]
MCLHRPPQEREADVRRNPAEEELPEAELPEAGLDPVPPGGR